MYCYKCGAQLPDDAIFCTKCGTKLAGITDSNDNTPSQDIITEIADAEKKDNDQEQEFDRRYRERIKDGVGISFLISSIEYKYDENIVVYNELLAPMRKIVNEDLKLASHHFESYTRIYDLLSEGLVYTANIHNKQINAFVDIAKQYFVKNLDRAILEKYCVEHVSEEGMFGGVISKIFFACEGTDLFESVKSRKPELLDVEHYKTVLTRSYEGLLLGTSKEALHHNFIDEIANELKISDLDELNCAPRKRDVFRNIFLRVIEDLAYREAWRLIYAALVEREVLSWIDFKELTLAEMKKYKQLIKEGSEMLQREELIKILLVNPYYIVGYLESIKLDKSNIDSYLDMANYFNKRWSVEDAVKTYNII